MRVALAGAFVVSTACAGSGGSASESTVTATGSNDDSSAVDTNPNDANPTDANPTDANPSDTDVSDTDSSGADGDTATPKAEPERDAGAVEAPAGVQPTGFTTVTVSVTADDGTECEVCLWLADSADERARGLMGVTDLGEPVGMVFRFDDVVAGNFWMFGTPMPLSIAWFTPDGTFVDEADMAPCVTDDSTECARYGPGADYLFAVEMVQGELDVIGIGPGSRFEILDEHERCP